MFGKTVKKLRKGKGFTIREFAALIRKKDGAPISPSYLCDIEQERRNPPDIAIIKQMAHQLKVDFDYLLGMANTTTPEIPALIKDQPVVGRLLREAKKVGFDDWKALERLIEEKKREKP